MILSRRPAGRQGTGFRSGCASGAGLGQRQEMIAWKTAFCNWISLSGWRFPRIVDVLENTVRTAKPSSSARSGGDGGIRGDDLAGDVVAESAEVVDHLVLLGDLQMALLAAPQRRLVAVGGDVGESVQEQLELLCGGLPPGGVGVQRQLLHQVDLIAQCAYEDSVLALEMAVHRRPGQPDRGTDLVDAHVLVSGLLEEERRGPDDLFGPLLTTRGGGNGGDRPSSVRP